jgi:hypothetical protein
MSNKYEALVRLEEILNELDDLGREAADLMRSEFPSLYRSGDAYGAFTFGRSWNRFDTTLAKLVESAEEYCDEEDYEEEEC